MPLIWITSRSNFDRSEAIDSFIRLADRASNRGDAADFNRPAPFGAGTSPSGRRKARPNLRVDTFYQHQAHRPPAIDASELGDDISRGRGHDPGARDLDLAPGEANTALRPFPAVPAPAF